MPISIAPTNLLPVGNQPTRISIRISRDLLKTIDPSMDPLVEGDSFTQTKRKGRAAIKQLTHNISMALFGSEVARLPFDFGWPKDSLEHEGQELRTSHFIAFCFDHQIQAENSNPRVIELTAEEEVGGFVIFHACDVDRERRQGINGFVNDAIREFKLYNDLGQSEISLY